MAKQWCRHRRELHPLDRNEVEDGAQTVSCCARNDTKSNLVSGEETGLRAVAVSGDGIMTGQIRKETERLQ